LTSLSLDQCKTGEKTKSYKSRVGIIAIVAMAQADGQVTLVSLWTKPLTPKNTGQGQKRQVENEKIEVLITTDSLKKCDEKKGVKRNWVSCCSQCVECQKELCNFCTSCGHPLQPHFHAKGLKLKIPKI